MVAVAPLQPEDYAEAARWLSDPESNRWLYSEWRENVITEKLLALIASSPKNKLWLFRLDNLAYGLGGVTNISAADRSALVWYLRGLGVPRAPGAMTTAVTAMVREAFDLESVHSLSASVHAGNHASEQLLRRVGFREVGVMREAFFSAGRFVDRVVFDLLESDLPPGTGPAQARAHSDC